MSRMTKKLPFISNKQVVERENKGRASKVLERKINSI